MNLKMTSNEKELLHIIEEQIETLTNKISDLIDNIDSETDKKKKDLLINAILKNFKKVEGVFDEKRNLINRIKKDYN